MVATVVYAMRTEQASGQFLNVPHDFRFPTLRRVRNRIWNPDDRRLFMPNFLGVGWSLNMLRVVERIRKCCDKDDFVNTT